MAWDMGDALYPIVLLPYNVEYVLQTMYEENAQSFVGSQTGITKQGLHFFTYSNYMQCVKEMGWTWGRIKIENGVKE